MQIARIVKSFYSVDFIVVFFLVNTGVGSKYFIVQLNHYIHTQTHTFAYSKEIDTTPRSRKIY